MIQVAVCDDDKILANIIENYVIEISKQYGVDIETEVYYKGQELLKDIESGIKYDLLYLDIEMKEDDGIKVGKKIRKIGLDVIIIYVSSFENYLRELFEVSAFRFIDKPIDETIFIEYYLAAIEKIKRNNIYYSFRFKKQISKIKMNDILYFESNKRKVNIYLEDGKVYTYYAKLNDVEKEIKEYKIDFLRIHQSYLVNYSFIKHIRNSEVELTNGTVLPISEERHKNVLNYYSVMLKKELFDE